MREAYSRRRRDAPPAPPPKPSTPRPGGVGPTAEARGRRYVLVCVFGLRGDYLRRRIALAREEITASGDVPIFVTDDVQTAPFLRARVSVEPVALLPRADEALRTAYVATRLQRIRRRWAPVAVVNVGRPLPPTWKRYLHRSEVSS